jgi:hypothetical protein
MIAAIDPEFGAVIEARNRRRLSAATRIARKMGVEHDSEQRGAVLAALTSFEFFDAVAENCGDVRQVETIVLKLAHNSLF